jgi:hypothetical protein
MYSPKLCGAIACGLLLIIELLVMGPKLGMAPLFICSFICLLQKGTTMSRMLIRDFSMDHL